jgi:hypothetical protein
MVGERRAPNSSIKGEENVVKLRLVPPTRTRTAIGDEISGTGWSPETAVPFAQTLSVGTLARGVEPPRPSPEPASCFRLSGHEFFVFIFFFLEKSDAIFNTYD